jgi:hypothetical protein
MPPFTLKRANMFTIRIEKRDFSGVQPLPGGEYRVLRMRREALGGPARAVIDVRGAITPAGEYYDLLRCPIEIQDSIGCPAWWGVITRVAVQRGALRAAVDLNGMSNRVAAVYPRVLPGGMGSGPVAVTPWAEDADSIAAYGLKEERIRLAPASDEAALAARDVQLSLKRYPQAAYELFPGGEDGVILTASGWFETLGWRAYSRLAGQEGSLAGGPGTQVFGASPATMKIAQSFSPAESWLAARVAVRLRRSAAPVDRVRLELCADGGGVPGAALAWASVDAAVLRNEYSLYRVELSQPVALEAGATYWLTVSRSGALDPNNYYLADVDEGCAYTRGVLRIWNGAAWLARVPAASLLFAVQGLEETTRQMERMAAADCGGQFLTEVDVETPSGKLSGIYRDGERTALAELLDLLVAGGANGRRLLAQVGRERRLRIYEEPVPGSQDFRLLPDGSLADAWGSVVPPWLFPAGVWLKVGDVHFGGGYARPLADAGRAFVETVEYYADSGQLSITPRRAAN